MKLQNYLVIDLLDLKKNATAIRLKAHQLSSCILSKRQIKICDHMPDKLPRGPCHLSATNHMNVQMIHTLGSISPVINHNTKSYEVGIT
jgi:hypothetical protein